MAKPTLELIQILRAAAKKLEASPRYQWGHMGACNCGFLAQQVTRLSQAEIHRRALLRCGDWSEQLNDYCPVNGLPFDDVITELIAIGFDSDDLKHLERLSDPKILRTLPLSGRNLRHNVKTDVVKYMKTWAGILEDELLPDITIPWPQKEVLAASLIS